MADLTLINLTDLLESFLSLHILEEKTFKSVQNRLRVALKVWKQENLS